MEIYHVVHGIFCFITCLSKHLTQFLGDLYCSFEVYYFFSILCVEYARQISVVFVFACAVDPC